MLTDNQVKKGLSGFLARWYPFKLVSFHSLWAIQSNLKRLTVDYKQWMRFQNACIYVVELVTKATDIMRALSHNLGLSNETTSILSDEHNDIVLYLPEKNGFSSWLLLFQEWPPSLYSCFWKRENVIALTCLPELGNKSPCLQKLANFFEQICVLSLSF